MHRMFFTYITFILLSITFADSNQRLKNLSWILGEWSSVNDSTITIETWTKVSDKSFEGYGLTRTNNEAGNKIFETLRIVEMSDHIYYLAKVAHNDLPIAFALTEFSDSLAVFENPGHDFPKKISYLLQKNEILKVTVSSDSKSFAIYFEKQNEQDN